MSKIELVKSGRKGTGKALLLKHLSGQRLTATQAIKAKCYDCMGYYVDGRRDCKMPDCAIYRWMPYKGEDETTEEMPPVDTAGQNG